MTIAFSFLERFATMKRTASLAVAACLVTVAMPAAWAHPGKGHGGHKHDSHAAEYHPYRGGSYREDFRDGTCRVQRKWDKKGRYKEKRDCHAHGPHVSGHGLRPYPPQQAAALPGLYVQPPAVVIQPPGVVIR